METDHPRITLDGNEFVLKITLGGVRRLDEMGVDLTHQSRVPTAEEPLNQHEQVEGLRTVCAQVAAFAHIETPQKKLRPAMLSADEVEDALTYQELPAVQTALLEALKKITPAETTSGTATALITG